MIHAIVSGNLGRDAELGDKDGTPVATFSVASNARGKGGDRETTWVSCKLFGKRAVSLAPYLTKGTRVAVAGSLRAWIHEGQARVGLDVSDVDLLGGGERQSESRPRPVAPARVEMAQRDFGSVDDDKLF